MYLFQAMGKHPNPTTLNAWFANSLNAAPGSVLYGEAWLGGNGLVINGSAVQFFLRAEGKIHLPTKLVTSFDSVIAISEPVQAIT